MNTLWHTDGHFFFFRWWPSATKLSIPVILGYYAALIMIQAERREGEEKKEEFIGGGWHLWLEGAKGWGQVHLWTDAVLLWLIISWDRQMPVQDSSDKKWQNSVTKKGDLQESLNATWRVFRSSAVHSMRQEHHKAALQQPLHCTHITWQQTQGVVIQMYPHSYSH